MINYKLKKKATYLVACTYGSDSMALVDMVQKEGIKPIVVCINYHKFEEADNDYVRLAQYCGARGLVFEYLDANELPEGKRYEEGKNFKTWARTTRYAFFKEIYEKYHAAGLLLAHQQDDLLETYLLQKQRKRSSANYGISPVSTVDGMIIIRPLLAYTKQDLIEYDEENGVPYSVKKSSFEDTFIRSPIRQEINAMSQIEREQLILEMEAANDEEKKLVSEFKTKIDSGEELEIRPLIALPKDAFETALMEFVAQAPEDIILTPEDFDKIRKFCLSPKPNGSLHLGGNTYLIKEYDIITLGREFDELPYTYTLEAPGTLSTPDFDLDFSMGAEDRNIKPEDYPLTIRTALTHDTYVVHGYLESIHALYSMWKMPVRLRYIWPIFLNKDGKVVYVPRYRQNFSEYHSSVLKMHLKDSER